MRTAPGPSAPLVDDDRRAEFVRAVGELARDAPPVATVWRPGPPRAGNRRAMEVTVSGPWIPYSFARPDRVECAVHREVRA
ncbi:hypothetical protein [Streptomyces hawaiiensis]|uniref:hypothetical protein n=1 Tax=Streptomyces hawaiiensis TaxID=67305 RepID=UPI00364F759A